MYGDSGSLPYDPWEDLDSDEEDALRMFPPGEEAVLQSHAGKEAIFHQILDKVNLWHGDPRTRSDRVQVLVNAWRLQMPALVDAYLEFKRVGPRISDEDPAAWPLTVLGFEENGTHLFVHSTTTKETNESLILHGYIGASPEMPALAFPIRLFEIYRQIHRVCPRYSLDALSKTLTHLHHGPRKSTLAEQLSTAYDAYLEILRGVDTRVQVAMHRTGSWEMDNICAPCLYKTVGERPLKFSFLATMDGNNPLKLVDSTFRSGTTRADDRTSRSFRWLTPEEVDLYKDEV
ncbi:hypothetical protein B0H10DRAFT_1852436 [Mycena sp. CBHHK59/15]|nr:hypothetical protein B0H10DRAFT_1852436 [Mycena sp. CBHHK59/15]